MKRLVFDCETDGLLENVSKIHCIMIGNPETGVVDWYDPNHGSIDEALTRLSEADEIIGHNIINYDVPVIKKLYPEWTCNKVTDTMVLARVIFADIAEMDWPRWRKNLHPAKLVGSHSLKAWGFRLNVLKGTYGETTDWQHWDEQMSEYCAQDVTVTIELLKVIEKYNLPEFVKELEHKVATILARQERHGFCFDQKKAQTLYAMLVGKRAMLKEELQGIFPDWYSPGKEFVPARTMKRTTAGGWKELTVEGCPMTKIQHNYFNPGSGQHIEYWFKRKYNWQPVDFTEKGQAKVDDDVIKKLEYPEAPKIAEYLLLNKRASQLAEGKSAWLKMISPKTQRIHGSVNTNGAVTGRMTHFCPNMAQVPAGYSPYGKECRELFTPPPGYKQVGCDASSLELCCLGHYLARWDEGEYSRAVTEGKKEDATDAHSLTKKALGIESRDVAKTFMYAWLYGAGDEKLGKILNCSASKSKSIKKKFLKNLPALGFLKEAIEDKVKTKKYLIGIDGRTLKIRSPHAALNTLLQSAGAIVMKVALVLYDEEMQRRGYRNSGFEYGSSNYDYEFMGNVHDETQQSVRPELSEEAGKLFAESITKAGDVLKFKCPLSGDYQIGDSWKDCH